MSTENKITIIGFLTMFVIGSSDYIIIGVISPMSEAFKVDKAMIGQLVTLYAISFAVLSPLLTKLTMRFNDKNTLIYSLVLFIIANFLTILTKSFLILCLLRIALAAFASLITVKLMAIGAKMVNARNKAKVVANIYVGFSAANILGVPLGTLLAAHFAWTSPFYFIGIIAFICLLMVTFLIKIPTNSNRSVSPEGNTYKILNTKAVLGVLIFLLLMMISNSLLFTYLEPMILWGGHSISSVSIALFLAGLFGVIGSKLGNILSQKFGYYISGLCIVLVYIVSLLIILFFIKNIVLVLIGVTLWNLFHWGTNPTVQFALLQFIEGDPSQIFSYNISLLNLGIGLGSIIGGILYTIDPHFSLSLMIAVVIAIVSVGSLIWCKQEDMKRIQNVGYSDH